jgi:hypothetical protein
VSPANRINQLQPLSQVVDDPILIFSQQRLLLLA